MKNVDEIFELIAEQVADISSHVAHGPITPGSMLSPLGMDSIGRAELIERMLEILKLNESRFHFHEANNLGELAQMFEKKLKDRETRESTNTRDSANGHFKTSFLKPMFYQESHKPVRLKLKAVNCTWTGARSVYLLIVGIMILICGLIVMRHEVRGFYAGVLKEINTGFYIQKSPFGF